MTETAVAAPVETRDTKLEIIMGREALDKLADATVLVLGCGGVGSNCCEALARGGIGHFVILDKDIIAPSNINRQAIAFHSTIGKRKVDVMEAMIHDINPCRHRHQAHRIPAERQHRRVLRERFGADGWQARLRRRRHRHHLGSLPLPNMLRTTAFVWLAPWAGPTAPSRVPPLCRHFRYGT